MKEINVPFSRQQAMDKQRYCNVCHTGCLDCHYEPDSRRGAHSFAARPSSESCGGYGRGTSICHPGSMQSRRGGTYIGGDYSLPTGMESDTHYKKKIHCIDCHATGEKGMGDIQRKAQCQDCHVEIEESHSRGIHRGLDCAACHVNELRGYQIVAWGPGKVAGRDNPFKKYSLYYGIQHPPLLMKDQKGRWMAVKVWPHSVGNIREDVPPSTGMRFRWPGGETRDPYYVVGTFTAPSNNRHLLWIEIQQASHPFGKGRSCESCHSTEQQVTTSRWEYMDDQGAAESFSGGYTITAGRSGLRIHDLKSDGPIRPAEGYKLEDFASWVYFRDAWTMPGDFSIRTDKDKYERYLKMSRRIRGELGILKPKPGEATKKEERRYRELRGRVLHDEDGAPELLRDYKMRQAR